MSGKIGSYLTLTKPKVVILLQITGIFAVISHDLLEDGGLTKETVWTMFVVLIGGFLTAGGANSINMWYDRDIDPLMKRTSGRPIPMGEVSPSRALIFGVSFSVIGTFWLYLMSNSVAAFWAAFSVIFYVFIYSIWLKRSTSQNIVIGGIAGSTPPLVGWSASDDSLAISTESAESAISSITDLGSSMPWLMFLIIFLWTPPHFWALALYRSKEYEDVGVPMLPNVKGNARTLFEMKIYSILIILASFYSPIANGNLDGGDKAYHALRWSCFFLCMWYASTVWRIDIDEELDGSGRMPTAARSFFFSLAFLAMFFLLLLSSGWEFLGVTVGILICGVWIFKLEYDSRKKMAGVD